MVALSEITGCILGLAAEAGGTPVAPISPRTKYFIRIAVVAHDATGDGDGGEVAPSSYLCLRLCAAYWLMATE